MPQSDTLSSVQQRGNEKNKRGRVILKPSVGEPETRSWLHPGFNRLLDNEASRPVTPCVPSGRRGTDTLIETGHRATGCIFVQYRVGGNLAYDGPSVLCYEGLACDFLQ